MYRRLQLSRIPQANALNAGVDFNNFEPVGFDELLKNNNEFYDGIRQLTHTRGLTALEMPISEAVARDRCIFLGKIFISLYCAAYEEGRKTKQSYKGELFNYYRRQMQAIYDEVKEITLKPDGLPLDKTQLEQWFLEAGRLCGEEYIVDPLAAYLYDEYFCPLLLDIDGAHIETTKPLAQTSRA